MGIQFSQPCTTYSIWLWKSESFQYVAVDHPLMKQTIENTAVPLPEIVGGYNHNIGNPGFYPELKL
jgi:hypothetical protein